MPRNPRRTSLIDKGQIQAIVAGIPELQSTVTEKHIDELCNQEDTDFDHALLIYLSNQTEPIIFFDKQEINVGRSEGYHNPDLNLEYFDSSKRGVSRLHAQIIYDGEQYVIQDLHSTNGTWLNHQKLDPYQPTPITNDATIQCASVPMRVYNITSC